MRRGSEVFGQLRGSKLICAFLLAFQLVFLNVVLPGHTRGAITLSGKSSVGSLRDLGCPCCAPSGDSKKSPSRQDQADCAICHLALRIASEAPFDFRLTDLGLLRIVAPAGPECIQVVEPFSGLFSRGPPVL